MTKLTAVGIVAAIILLTAVPASAQKLVYVVRHAERADGGAGTGAMTGAPADPLLSAAGEARASRLASLLADAGIKAIFVTEFKRTQDTGKPLAAKLGITPRLVPSRETNSLVAALQKDHANDIVLVIGHSNTLPAILKALGGPDVTIADGDYDSLFIIVPRVGTMTRIRY